MARRSPTLAQLGETRFLRRLARLIPPPEEGVVGIGDDAAVLPGTRGSQFLTTDSLVEGTHFRRTWFRPEEVGYKALAVNLSDAAAMGGQPRFAVVSLVLPGSVTMRAVERLYRGMQRLAWRTGVTIVGGNVAEGESISVTISLLGSFLRSEPVLRSGARPGDRLYVSGQPGLARLGYRLLDRRRPPGQRGRAPRRPDLWGDSGGSAPEWRRKLGRSTPGAAAALRRFLTPEHRLALARDLTIYRPTALIDVSDGLGSDLFHLLDETPGQGILLDAARFPLTPSFRKLAKALGEEPRDAMLQGGEDYELLVSLLPDTAERLGDRVLLSGTPLTAIGTVVPERGVRLDGEKQIQLPRSGFQHFQK